jgi:hypothetical protein
MTRRLVAIIAALALAAVTAGGGVAYAQQHAVKHHHVTGHHKAKHASTEAEETATEESSEEATGDGPGGHEDEPGAEVDHQAEGVE